MVTIILVVIIVGLVTIFSVQNAAPVALSFLFWKTQASLALAIFLSALAGLIVGAITVLMVLRGMSHPPKDNVK